LPKLFYGTFEFMSKDFVKEIKRFKFLVVFKRFQKSGVFNHAYATLWPCLVIGIVKWIGVAPLHLFLHSNL